MSHSKPVWRKLLDTVLADPQKALDDVRRYVRDVEAGVDPIEALHGHICSPECWHNALSPKNWPCKKCNHAAKEHTKNNGCNLEGCLCHCLPLGPGCLDSNCNLCWEDVKSRPKNPPKRWDFCKHPQCAGCLNTGWDAGHEGTPCLRCHFGDARAKQQSEAK